MLFRECGVCEDLGWLSGQTDLGKERKIQRKTCCEAEQYLTTLEVNPRGQANDLRVQIWFWHIYLGTQRKQVAIYFIRYLTAIRIHDPSEILAERQPAVRRISEQ